jgi:tripartite motif-containing protein 45
LNLCDRCRDVHKRHAESHDIKYQANATNKKKLSLKNVEIGSIKCLIHPKNYLKLFCTTCRQMICSECTILIHRGHKMTSTSKASKIYIEMLKDAKDSTKPLSTYALHSISKLNDISRKINQKCDTVEEDVEIFLSEYLEALEVHKRCLLTQIERCRATKMDMIHSQQHDLERRSNEAKTVIEFTENLLRDGNDEENLMLVSLLLKKLDDCRSSKNNLDIKITDTIQFLPKVKAPINDKNIPLYGIITTQVAVAKNSTLENSNVLKNLRVNKKTELILQTRDNEGNLMCHGCASIEVTVSYCDVAFKSLPVQINDKRDGTYTICFVPDIPGQMKISISVNSKPILESPFSVRARNLRPHAGIFHCCSFCSSNGKKVCKNFSLTLLSLYLCVLL